MRVQTEKRTVKLKVLSSHPVQYHVPFFRELVAAGIDIEVGYYHQGTAGRSDLDADFGIDIEWDIDLLSGYDHRIFCDGKASYSLREQLQIAPRLLTWSMRNRQTPLLLVGWFVHLIWLVWLIRVAIGAKVLVLAENNLLSAAMAAPSNNRKRLLGWLLRHSAVCLYIGQRNREFYLTHGVAAERLFHVPYSIDNKRFSQTAHDLLPQRNELCRTYGLTPELPVFLFCGKLIHKKRPVQFLEAYLAAELKDRAQLLFVGEGVLRPEIEARARQADARNVHSLGFLNQSQMPLAYVLGELLCLISEPTETWGLVVNEALACGRPVIVSDTVGCSVDLVQPANGWVVGLDDHDEIVNTLRTAYEHYAAWPQMGEHGRQRIQANSFAAMADGTCAALEFMIQNAK